MKIYYNSKYIDAEETDVSRNQTSTWLMKAEVVSKEEIYSETVLLVGLEITGSFNCSLINQLLKGGLAHGIQQLLMKTNCSLN